MRVVVDGVVYGRQGWGGINVYFNQILPRLAARADVSVELWVPRRSLGVLPGGAVKHARRDVLPERTGLSWKLDTWIMRRLAPWVNESRREWHARRGRASLFQSTYFTWVSRRVPQVATAYDMNHELFPELYRNKFGIWLRPLYREYLLGATRIIAISHKTKADIVRFYGIDPGRIDVVHLAVDRSAFHPEPDDPRFPADDRPAGGALPSRPYVLYVGMRHGYKNFQRLLETVGQWRDGEGVDLVVAGAEWTETERESIARSGLGNRLRLVIRPDTPALRRLYAQSLAFVYPSLHEGFGIPLLEAMACGTPVLCSDTEVFREVAGDAAVYFDPQDPDAIRKAIEAVGDTELRRDHRAKGLARVAQFSWDRCADETYQVYRRVLENA